MNNCIRLLMITGLWMELAACSPLLSAATESAWDSGVSYKIGGSTFHAPKGWTVFEAAPNKVKLLSANRKENLDITLRPTERSEKVDVITFRRRANEFQRPLLYGLYPQRHSARYIDAYTVDGGAEYMQFSELMFQYQDGETVFVAGYARLTHETAVFVTLYSRSADNLLMHTSKACRLFLPFQDTSVPMKYEMGGMHDERLNFTDVNPPTDESAHVLQVDFDQLYATLLLDDPLYPELQAAITKVEADAAQERRTKGAEGRTLEEELKSLKREASQQPPGEARAALDREIAQKQDQIKAFAESMRGFGPDVRKRIAAVRSRAVHISISEIVQLTKDFAAKNGYDVVLDETHGYGNFGFAPWDDMRHGIHRTVDLVRVLHAANAAAAGLAGK